MREMLQFYINGEWVDPVNSNTLDVINPANETVCGRISMGGVEDVDRAVAAAVAAADAYAASTRDQRIDLLQGILDRLKERNDEIATAIMEEMGAPWPLAQRAQAPSGPQHFAAALDALKSFEFEERHGSTMIRKEPIGERSRLVV